MPARSLNWLKFGGLVGLAFMLGLLFAGLLDLPRTSLAQQIASATRGSGSPVPEVKAPAIPEAKSLSDLSTAFAAVAEAVRPSVVFIRAQKSPRANPHSRQPLPPGLEQFFGPRLRGQPPVQQGTGTGFVVSADGYIVTNNHVIEGADKVTVRLLDRREFTARVVGADANTDIAVLRVEATDLKPAALGDSDRERVGEWVLAIGNPLGDGLTFTVTSGIIGAKGRRLNGLERTPLGISDFIQTDAAINPGNSGGPLVNVRGEVIGVNSAIASETGTYMGYGFAIPINLARNVMNQLITEGKVHRAAMGVSINDVSPEDAKYAGLTEIRGVIVGDFSGDDSPAEKAGIRAGDIILAIDGKPIERTSQLQQEIGFRRPGETVQVEIARKGGQRKTVSVKLKALDERALAATTRPGEGEDEAPEDGVGEGASFERLGLTVQPVTPRTARDLGLRLPEDVSGLVITQLAPGSPASEKLSTGEVITSIEDKAVRTEGDLRAALKGLPVGSVVSLRVYTPLQGGGQRRFVRLQLGAE